MGYHNWKSEWNYIKIILLSGKKSIQLGCHFENIIDKLYDLNLKAILSQYS